MWVTFLGPPGTYSHQVALGVYPDGVLQEGSSSSDVASGVNLVACATITSTIQEAATLSTSSSPTQSLQALVPLSNSTFGPVKETYSLLNLSSSDNLEEGQELDVRWNYNDTTIAKAPARVRVVKKIVNSIEHSLLVHQSTWDALTTQDQDASADELPLESLRRITEVRSHEQVSNIARMQSMIVVGGS